MGDMDAQKRRKWIGFGVGAFFAVGIIGSLFVEDEPTSSGGETKKEKAQAPSPKEPKKPSVAERADELGLPVECFEHQTCVVTKDVGDDIVGIDLDRELLMKQQETWENLAKVPGLFRAKVVLEGETTDISGNSSNSPILSVLCDGKQIRRINWEDVDPDRVKALCAWQEEVQFE